MILFPNFLARSEAMGVNGDKERRKKTTEGAPAHYIKKPVDQILSDLAHMNNRDLGFPRLSEICHGTRTSEWMVLWHACH
jgi:hypothetical protein